MSYMDPHIYLYPRTIETLYKDGTPYAAKIQFASIQTEDFKVNYHEMSVMNSGIEYEREEI